MIDKIITTNGIEHTVELDHETETFFYDRFERNFV